MPDEVRLWQIGPDNSLREIERAALDLETRLQEWLARDISVLDPDLLVIGREVETDFGGYIDLLCIDSAGDLVVIELKRDRTPREITAQVLDYGSWVDGLPHARVTSIADKYLVERGFEQTFRERFGSDVPETLNSDHRLLVVGSRIDDSTERIIKYLSDKHSVNINAATFQYFPASDGAQFLARVFLIEPSTVELQSRAKGTSKRRPNLTPEELGRLAQESGVQELYDHALESFERHLRKRTTRSTMGFTSQLGGGNKVVVSLLPGQSSSAEGLHYQLCKHRFAALADLTEEEVEGLMPASRKHWEYVPDDPDWEGFEGFIQTREEIDRLANALSRRS